MVITGRVSKQKVQVMLEYITKGAEMFRRNSEKFNKGIEAQAALTESLTKTQKANTNSTNMNATANKGFGGVMRMGMSEFKQFNEQGRKFSTIGGAMANRMRLATHGLRGFRMEMLGVMFFGMAMQRVFSGLLKTSLTWVGVTEIMTTALGILFLPVALMILDWAIAFLGWVNQLTEAQKLFIGKMVLAGIAIGAFLFLVGTLALGLGSLIQVFGFLLNPIGLVLTALGFLAAYVLGRSFFGKLSDEATELDGVMTQGLDFGALLEKLKEGVSKAIDWLAEKLPEWGEKGLEIVSSILDGMAEKTDEITEVISNLVENMITWVAENADKIFEVGVAIAKGIIKGIGHGLLNIGEMFRFGVLEKLEGRGFGPTTPTGGGFGTSSASPGGSGGTVNIVNNNNVTVSDKSEFETMLNEYGRNQDDEIKRIFKIV